MAIRRLHDFDAAKHLKIPQVILLRRVPELEGPTSQMWVGRRTTDSNESHSLLVKLVDMRAAQESEILMAQTELETRSQEFGAALHPDSKPAPFQCPTLRASST